MRCYRHPERPAYRRCRRCGKPTCEECLVQTDLGAMCVECAKQGRPDTRTRVRYWSARQPTLVTYALIAINVAVFVIIALNDPSTLSGETHLLRQSQESGLQQWDLGLSKFFIVADGEWYRIVTSGFLHFGVIHLGFNMLILYQLGQLLEPPLGRVRFALLYLAALLGGSAGVLLLQPNTFAGGASGAVFGLLGAACAWLLRQGINPLTTGLGSLLLINLMLTFWIPNISIGAHLGGLVAGAASGWFMLSPRWRPMPNWVTYATPIAVSAIAIAICYLTTRSAAI
jgi:membrane associated rhomboid family serine protease